MFDTVICTLWPCHFLEVFGGSEDESEHLFQESALIVHIQTCLILSEVNSNVPFSSSQLSVFLQFALKTTVFLGENGKPNVSKPRESGERSVCVWWGWGVIYSSKKVWEARFQPSTSFDLCWFECEMPPLGRWVLTLGHAVLRGCRTFGTMTEWQKWVPVGETWNWSKLTDSWSVMVWTGHTVSFYLRDRVTPVAMPFQSWLTIAPEI